MRLRVDSTSLEQFLSERRKAYNVNNMVFRYEQLHTGDEILAFVDEIYKLTSNFPTEERFGLINQIRRAAVSIYLNLAEGSTRRSKKELARFVTISLGSLIETHAGLRIALRLGYISGSDFTLFQTRIKEIWFDLCKLRKSQLG